MNMIRRSIKFNISLYIPIILYLMFSISQFQNIALEIHTEERRHQLHNYFIEDIKPQYERIDKTIDEKEREFQKFYKDLELKLRINKTHP